MPNSHTEIPLNNHSRPSEAERFKMAIRKAEELKEEFVQRRIKFYENNTAAPRTLFILTGIVLILCSASLPAFAALKEIPYHDMIVTWLSVSVAVLSGFATFFRWEHSWQGNSSALVALEQLCAKWKLELGKAENAMEPEKRIDHVYKATEDLLTHAKNVVAGESGAFFQGLKIPGSDKGSKHA